MSLRDIVLAQPEWLACTNGHGNRQATPLSQACFVPAVCELESQQLAILSRLSHHIRTEPWEELYGGAYAFCRSDHRLAVCIPRPRFEYCDEVGHSASFAAPISSPYLSWSHDPWGSRLCRLCCSSSTMVNTTYVHDLFWREVSVRGPTNVRYKEERAQSP